jgi:hypothetical protein
MSRLERGRGGNEGIQGNVTAEVLAVGRHASATKTVALADDGRAEVEAALQRLQKAVAALQVSPGAQEMLKADVSQLRHAVAAEEPDKEKVQSVLGTIAGKVKMLGEASEGVIALMEPLGKIAGLFHLSLAAIGLL